MRPSDFQNHCGTYCALDMYVADPRVVLDSDGAALYADVTSRHYDTGLMIDYPDVRFALVEAASVVPDDDDGWTVWNRLQTSLTAEGVPAFANFYPEGGALDPVSIRYQGPGGPVSSAAMWARPGDRLYERSGSYDLAAFYPGWIAADDAHGLVHVYDFSGWRAVDRSTGLQVGARLAASPQVPNQGFSPTVFAMAWDEANDQIVAPVGTDVITLRWDPEAEEYVRTVIYSGSVLRQAAVSPDGQLVAVRRNVNATASSAATYVVLARQEDGSYLERATYAGVTGFDTNVFSMAVTDDGRIFITRSGGGSGAVGVPDGSGGLDVSDIPGTDGASQVVTGPSGDAYMSVTTPNRVVTVAPVEGGGHEVTASADLGGVSVGHIALGIDLDDETVYLSSPGRSVRAVRDGRVVAAIDTPWTYDHAIHVGGDGGLYVARDLVIDRFDLVAEAPTITASPVDVDVTYLGEPVSASFVAEATGDPAPTVRWQSAPAGSTQFTDVPGADSTTLSATYAQAVEGRQYRAVFTNAAGDVPTEVATLQVRTAPGVIAQLEDVTVVEGDDGSFKVMPSGNPYPVVTWQRYSDGFWVNITDETDGFVVDGGFLTVTGTNTDQSGARFRARLRNEVGTVHSRTATLTVTERNVATRHVVGGDLDWGVRESFRDYIVGPVAHGEITTALPASVTEAGTFAFPASSGTVVDRAVDATFDGGVRFVGHVGVGTPPGVPALEVDISDVRIAIGPDGRDGQLIADVVSRGLASGELVTYDDVALADLDLTGVAPVPEEDGVRYGDVPAALAGDGVAAFADFYPAGSPLDPVTFRLVLSDEPHEPAPPRTATESFVTAALVDFLGRAPTETQVATGVAQVETAGKSAFLRSLTTSEEWLASIVDELYLDTLGRPADAAGATFWIGRLGAGWTVARVAASFYAATEYYDGIGGGTDGSWVSDLYANVLGRAPDAPGLAFWIGEAATRGRADVALRLYQSDESARARVTGLYRDLLGRAPDAGGLTYWATLVVARGDLSLAADLAVSGEYQARARHRYP